MTTTNMGLKLPSQDDFYDIDDFNNNTVCIEAAINSLSSKIDALTATVDRIPIFQMITGIITGNGELAFGWAPRAVFIFGNRFNNASTDFIMQSVAFANGNAATHRQVNTINGTVTTVLETTSLGFITRTMIGGQLHDPSVSATAPLRYLAIR